MKFLAGFADGQVVIGPMRKLRQMYEEGVGLNLNRDLRRASDLRRRGWYAESRSLFASILRRHPGEPRAEWHLQQLRFAQDFDLADALHGEGRTVDAEEVVSAVIRRFPGEPEPHLRLAPMLAVRGAIVEAAEHAAAAAEGAWDDPNSLFRAASCARYGDPEASRRYLTRMEQLLMRQGTEAGFPFRADVWHLEGLLAYEGGAPHVAVERFEAAFEAEPDGVGVGADLALIYAELGRYSEALDVVARALEHRPGDERLVHVQAQIAGETS
jgi:tetratricopeptide (TPR) repeat protein